MWFMAIRIYYPFLKYKYAHSLLQLWNDKLCKNDCDQGQASTILVKYKSLHIWTKVHIMQCNALKVIPIWKNVIIIKTMP